MPAGRAFGAAHPPCDSFPDCGASPGACLDVICVPGSRPAAGPDASPRGCRPIRHDAIGNVHLQVLSHNDWGLLPDTRAQHLRNAGPRWLGMAERRWKWIWRTTASGAQPGKKGDRSLWATLGPPRTYCPQLPITEDNGAELIPLTTGEIRRLFNLYTRVIRHARHHERWSRWRRRPPGPRPLLPLPATNRQSQPVILEFAPVAG